MDHALDIVVVCTGNRFRSPIAEHLLRRRAEGLPVRLRSFGVLDLGSVEALPEALDEGAALGLDLKAHKTHALTNEQLQEADLVIGFERAHVMHAVVEAGARLDRTFTLPELVELLEAISSSGEVDFTARARESIARAARARTVDPRRGPLPELRDPIGQSAAVYRSVANDVGGLTDRLARHLFGN